MTTGACQFLTDWLILLLSEQEEVTWLGRKRRRHIIRLWIYCLFIVYSFDSLSQHQRQDEVCYFRKERMFTLWLHTQGMNK